MFPCLNTAYRKSENQETRCFLLKIRHRDIQTNSILSAGNSIDTRKTATRFSFTKIAILLAYIFHIHLVENPGSHICGTMLLLLCYYLSQTIY